MRLTEMVAVVTGAGSGIGACVARVLAKNGVTVALVGRRADRLKQVMTEIRQANGKAVAFPCNVSDPNQVAQLEQQIRATLGVATVLFNGAGVFGEAVPVAHSSPEKWIDTLQINVTGPYLMCRAFMAGMTENGWGRIINVSSAATVLPPGGHSSAYQLSKVALNWFTRQIAAELNGTGVTANAIHPGEVKTEMWAAIKTESETHANPGMRQWANMVEQTGGDAPEKTADLVLKLLGPGSEDVNGQFLWIENGIKKPVEAW